MSERKIDNVKSVEFDSHRWDVRIILTMEDGREKVFIASSDSWFTEGDGIWFGSENEYIEDSP